MMKHWSGNQQGRPTIAIVIIVLALLLVCTVPAGCSLFSSEKSSSPQPVDEETKVDQLREVSKDAASTVANATDSYHSFSSSYNSNRTAANAQDLSSKYLSRFRSFQTEIQGFRNQLNTLSFSDKDYTQALELEKQAMAQADLALNTLCEGLQTAVSGNVSTAIDMINSYNTQMSQATDLMTQAAALF